MKRGFSFFTGQQTLIWRALALVAWALALTGATVGYVAGRTIYDRGVVFGDPGSALPDLDGPRRAVNTQLEVEPDAEAQRRSLRMIREAGFGWIRQQFDWSQIEVGAKGQFYDYDRQRPTWDRYDQLVDAALAEGLQVVARIELPPEWARPPGSWKTHPPVNVQDYADFVAAFVDHFRGRVRYVQLWNEPNLNAEWGNQPVDPAAYVELLRAGYRAAKRSDPSVRVLSAALAQTLEPDAAGAQGLDDLLFLERMYALGAAPYFDVLAANAYGLRTGPDDRQLAPRYANFPRLLLARDVMVRYGDAHKAVWVSEFGWNALPANWSGQPSPWGEVTPGVQAANVTRAFDRADQEWPWLGPMALWLFRQPHPDPRDPTQYFGLVDDDWRPRPAYNALRERAAEQPLGPGVHQETSAGLRFEGLWQWTPQAGASLGAIRESPVSGASLRVRFRGTRLDLLAPAGPSRGLAYVKINGAYTLANRLPLNRNGQATLDFYAPREQPQRRIAVVDGLPDREHTFELVVTGEQQPASTGPGVGIDAVVVSRSRPLLPLVALAAGWAGAAAAAGWWARPALVGALAAPIAGLPPALERALALLAVVPWRKASVLAVAAALPLAPLTVRTPAGYFSPVELLSLLSIALGTLRLLAYGRLDGSRGRFAGPALALLLAGGVSLLAADYPHLALRELRTLVVEPVLFYLVARAALSGRDDGRALAGAFLAGAAGASLLALLQTALHRDLVAAEGVTRAAALYPSPNNLALLLDRAAPLAMVLLLAALERPGPRGWPVRLAAVTTGLLGAALFFTYSRGAWVAVAAGVALTLGSRWRRLWPAARRRRWVVLAAGVPALALLLLAGLRLQRFRSLLSTEGTGFLRVHLWLSSLEMARDHPVLGVGLDQFLYQYPRYLHPAAAREPNLSHPHDLFLDFWLRLGILGLIALGWALWVFVERARRPEARGEALVVATTAAGIAVLVHGLVDNSYFVLDLAYSTWIVFLLLELGGPRAERTLPQPAIEGVLWRP